MIRLGMDTKGASYEQDLPSELSLSLVLGILEVLRLNICQGRMLADGLSRFKLLPWSDPLLTWHVGRLLLHLLLELCCLLTLLELHLFQLLVLFPGLDAVDSSIRVQSDEPFVNQLLEVLLKGSYEVGPLLHHPHLLLHVIDPGHLRGDLRLSLFLHLALLLDLGLGPAPLGACLHEVVAVALVDWRE